MGQVRKTPSTKTARTRQQPSARFGSPMTPGERGRIIAAAEEYRAARTAFDPDYEEEYWQETEAEVARLLGKAW